MHSHGHSDWRYSGNRILTLEAFACEHNPDYSNPAASPWRRWRFLLRRTNGRRRDQWADRKSTRLNSSHRWISYAVFCFNKENGSEFLNHLVANVLNKLLIEASTARA